MNATEHSNETTVCISIIETIYVEDPQPREAWVFQVPGSISVEDVKSLYAPPNGFEPSNVLEKRYLDYEWGASASVTNYLVQMAQDLSSDMLSAGLGYIAAKVRSQISGLPDDEAFPPLDRDRAEWSASHAIVLAYKSASKQTLRVIREEETRNPVSYTFTYEDGSHQYEATVEQTSSGIAVSRVARITTQN